MSETLIASLQKRLDELTTENASLRSENKDRRIKSKASTTELETLREQVKTLTADRDTHKAKAEASQPELQGKIDELQGQVRTRDHRDAFAAVKEFAGADGKKYTLHPRATTEAVWTQLGYKADGETPKAEAVAAQYGKALESHPYLFAEVATAPGGATRPVTVASREAGPGAGKGSESPTVTASQAGQAASTAGSVPGRF